MFTNFKRQIKHNKYIWKYGLNFKPTLRYLYSSEKQEGDIKQVVDDLNKNGIALSSANKPLEDRGLFEELKEAVANLEIDQHGGRVAGSDRHW